MPVSDEGSVKSKKLEEPEDTVPMNMDTTYRLYNPISDFDKALARIRRLLIFAILKYAID